MKLTDFEKDRAIAAICCVFVLILFFSFGALIQFYRRTKNENTITQEQVRRLIRACVALEER